MRQNECYNKAAVTPDMLEAAQSKTDALFVALIEAKNDWQHAIKQQDEVEAYERVLRVKGEYAEWRALTESLREILASGNADARQAVATAEAARAPRLPIPFRRSA